MCVFVFVCWGPIAIGIPCLLLPMPIQNRHDVAMHFKHGLHAHGHTRHFIVNEVTSDREENFLLPVLPLRVIVCGSV